MARPKLTAMQKKYVKHVARGVPRDHSAILAGSTAKSTPGFDKSPAVQTELARIRAETAKNLNITKEEVAGMFIEAANHAKIMDDPMALIAAARELGKMLGFYAPEVKKIENGINAQELRKALKDMSDEELFKLAHARTIDGESTRIQDLPDLSKDKTSEQLLQT